MIKIIMSAVVAALALSACDSTKESLGLSPKAPDEFMVVPRAPLSLPPEYDFNPITSAQVKNNNIRIENLSSSDVEFLSKMNKSSEK